MSMQSAKVIQNHIYNNSYVVVNYNNETAIMENPSFKQCRLGQLTVSGKRIVTKFIQKGAPITELFGHLCKEYQDILTGNTSCRERNYNIQENLAEATYITKPAYGYYLHKVLATMPLGIKKPLKRRYCKLLMYSGVYDTGHRVDETIRLTESDYFVLTTDVTDKITNLTRQR